MKGPLGSMTLKQSDTDMTCWMARYDGEEVVVDNKFMREHYPLLVRCLQDILFVMISYEQSQAWPS